MVYVRLPRPTHSSVPQAAHQVCSACINALFLCVKQKSTETSTNTGVKMSKELLWGFGSLVISRSGFLLGRRSIKAVVIWSYTRGITMQIVSAVWILLRRRVAWSFILPDSAQWLYAQPVWCYSAVVRSQPRWGSPCGAAASPAHHVNMHGGRRMEGGSVAHTHSGWEGGESGPPVSYCKMKCLQSFVNVLIDLCPQTSESGVVSRRLFSTPRDAFIRCCWPALHPHYRATLPHTLPDCCNNFRHFYLPRQVLRQPEQFGGLTSNVRRFFKRLILQVIHSGGRGGPERGGGGAWRCFVCLLFLHVPGVAVAISH